MGKVIAALALFWLAVLFAVAAFAKGGEGFYIAPFGAVNWSEDGDTFGPVSFPNDTGHAFGVALGTAVDAVPGLRIEAEAAFRENGASVKFGPVTVADAYDETLSLMGNVVYDLPLKLDPYWVYVTAGVGYADREVGLTAFPLAIHGAGLAWKVGGGVNTRVADGVLVGVFYEHFEGPDLSLGPLSFDGGNDSAGVRVTLGFN